MRALFTLPRRSASPTSDVIFDARAAQACDTTRRAGAAGERALTYSLSYR
ncbi:hypothetical protein ABGB14_05445 [Nonomuraea sp. B10E15]